MPHLPDHQTHDPLVIAALAAGDAEGADLEQARELVASCSSCADLQRDLRAISAALPVMPAPVRTRDFRLTPEQAASIRPAGWRRFLAPLAGPRFAFAAPLGGSLAALGIAGILVASFAAAPIAGVRSGAGDATREQERVAAEASAEPGLGAMSGPASEAPAATDRLQLAPPPAAPASGEPDVFAPDVAGTGPAASDAAAEAGGTVAAKNQPEPTAIADTSISAADGPSQSPAPSPILGIVSLVVAGVGIALVALRLAGRRLGPRA